MPPKQKKQPKNSYYFYMMERKEQLEREGYRFPGGMKDVASAVGGEWAAMTAEDKMPYEEEARKAKDEGKNDLTNKYTSTGESYAQVQRRLQEDKHLADEQEQYISELGEGDGALDRIFILIKTIHCVEQIVERNQRIYWPLEVGLVAFNLRDGLQSIHWTLVDTQKTPVGYASAAKECSEETGLPEPGSTSMQEYRNYNKIMQHIQGFVRHWTKQHYKRGPVVFALDQETEHARGCLKWLANHVDDDKRRDIQGFVDTLKYYKLPKLILRLAGYANYLDPSYVNILVSQKLEMSAAAIVSKGNYDYKDEITCVFHRGEKASLKMYTCCRNVTLRRMYLMFEEFLPAFGLEKTDRHDMQKLREAQIAKASKAKADARAAAAAGPPQPEAMDHSPPPAFGRPTGGGSWGSSVPPPLPTTTSGRRDSGRKYSEEDVSDRYRDKRKHEDGGDWAEERAGPPTKRGDSFSSDSFRRDSRSRDSPSPPPAASTYRRLPREENEDFLPAPSAEFVPWGSQRPQPEPNFEDNDFPALGATAAPPPMMMRGIGRGRGAPPGHQVVEEEDWTRRDRDDKNDKYRVESRY